MKANSSKVKKAMNEWLTAFYDPPSRRMKVAAISYDIMSSVSFYHRGWAYHPINRFSELGTTYSKDGKIIGFGVIADDLTDQHYFRSAVNALNAVVGGRRNDLNPDRDVFSEIMKSNYAPSTYWWLTETWDEFENQLWEEGLDDDYPTDGASWAGNEPYVWEGMVKGKADGDFILLLESFEIDKIGFKPATENIPKWIPNSQTSIS